VLFVSNFPEVLPTLTGSPLLADIAAGRVGRDQPPPRLEFD